MIDHLKLFGYKYYHTRYSLGSNAGFPDLVAVKGGRLLFIELKTERGKCNDAQTDWGERLLLAAAHNPGVEYLIWRPSDLSCGDIERTLRVSLEESTDV